MMGQVQNCGVQRLQKSKFLYEREEQEEERSLNALSSGRSGTSMVDQGQSPLDDTGLSSTSHLCPAPICRQFWKAGNYSERAKTKVSIQSTKLWIIFPSISFYIFSSLLERYILALVLACVRMDVLIFFAIVLLLCLSTDGNNYLHVHPMFLHSNATSHKWAFGGRCSQYFPLHVVVRFCS